MKLSTKLVGAMTVVLFIAVVILTIVGTAEIRSSLEKEIGKSQLALATVTLAKIDQLLFERLQDIKAMADDERFEGLLAGKYSGEESQEKLEELLLNTGPWYELEIFSPEGRVVASVEEDEIGGFIDVHDQAEIPALTTALKGEVYISDVFVSEESGLQTMIFAAPVFDENSAERPVIGVIVGNLAWPVVVDTLDNLQGYDVYLLNRRGEEIAVSSTTGRYSSATVELRELIEEIAEGTHFEVHKQGIRNPEEVLTAIAKEQGHISYRGNEWWLVVETPTRTAFSSVVVVIRKYIVVAIATLILGILIALLIARSITRPLQELTQAADSISKGNLDVSINVQSTDEIGALSESLSFMRASLKAVISQYETMLASTRNITKPKRQKKKLQKSIGVEQKPPIQDKE